MLAGKDKMIRINQLKIDIDKNNLHLKEQIIKKLKLNSDTFFEFEIVKKSIDARNKDEIKYVYSVNVRIENEKKIFSKINDSSVEMISEKKCTRKSTDTVNKNKKTVIVGSGPAGLFAGYFLSINGYKPLIIERGESVEERTKSVKSFWEGGTLNPESNVQFGEGGAGTFSDGKLNTMVNDKFGRNRTVLEIFVKHGAPEEILYYNKPHIGTDVLSEVVKNIRNSIINHGGEILFNTRLTDLIIDNNCLKGIKVKARNQEEEIKCDNLILAIGHSSRDTFEMLCSAGLNMQKKPFAVGLRIEHPQKMIDLAQYGSKYSGKLQAADYKLTFKTPENRNVYSFCMCPGGYVVDSSSQKGYLAINGMSYSKRDGENANSAIIVSVNPDDFPDKGPLSGMEFQKKLEKSAYNLCSGKIPVQLFSDFKHSRKSINFGEYKPSILGVIEFGDISSILPDYIKESLVLGIDRFGKVIKGFNREDSILSGVESRTSSPVRILRDENLQSNIKGIFPCGEGAGYAGGITSAAMDGIKVFEEIAKIVYD